MLDEPLLLTDASLDAGFEEGSTLPERGEERGTLPERGEEGNGGAGIDARVEGDGRSVNGAADAADASFDSAGEAGADGAADANQGDGAVACEADAGVQPGLTAGTMHTCALSSNGSVRCWGYNFDGELGDGTTMNNHPTPAQANITGVSAIAAGGYHTCALMASTSGVRCWGYNADGQTGTGVTSTTVSPPAMDVLTGVRAIAAGYAHTCALMTSCGVRCWGQNIFGQLGVSNSVSFDPVLSPPATDVLQGVRAIAAGYAHTCAVTTNGGVRCWGWNQYGQLGDGTATDRSIPPSADVLIGTPVQAIALGYAHTCALTTAGAVRCWGDNSNGQVGDMLLAQRPTPGPDVPTLATATAVTAGDSHTCAVITGGAVQCWGAGDSGQLGDSRTTTSRPDPANVVGLGCP